jgi:hypothetical protein
MFCNLQKTMSAQLRSIRIFIIIQYNFGSENNSSCKSDLLSIHIMYIYSTLIIDL